MSVLISCEVGGTRIPVPLAASPAQHSRSDSTDGVAWNAVGSVSGTQALLLRSGDFVRYTGDGVNSETATLTYYGWDQTGTTSGQEGTKQDLVAIGTGTDTPFSLLTDTATVTVSFGTVASWAVAAAAGR